MLVQGPGAATRLGCRNVGIRTWDLLAEAPVGSWADRLGSLFVLGKRPSLGCLPPPPPPGQKGGLSATPLMKNMLNLMTEVSELKLKLVGMEKEQKEQEEKQKKAEVSAINHILGRTHTALSSDQGKLS